MDEKQNPDEIAISFGAEPSLEDYRTLSADMFAGADEVPERNRVDLDRPCTDDLCNQKKIGICTKCSVRMAAEVHFKDGVRLNEYWGYLIGKTLIDDPMYGGYHFEGSSALTMLKAAHKYGIPTLEISEKYPLKTNGTYEEFRNHFLHIYGGVIPQAILNDAAAHKIPGYYQVPVNPTAIARELAAGRLVITRFAVGENWYEDAEGNYSRKPRDLFPLRAPKAVESGHLTVLNENDGLLMTSLFAGPNSWGEGWGDDGFYNFVFNVQAPHYLTEAWAIADNKPEVIEFVRQLPEAKDFKYPFPNRIERGDTGEEVKKLHIALSILGFLNIRLDEWGHYGPKTAAGVLAYQKARKLLPVAQLETHGGNYVHGLTLGALRRDFAR